MKVALQIPQLILKLQCAVSLMTGVTETFVFFNSQLYTIIQAGMSRVCSVTLFSGSPILTSQLEGDR